MGKSKIRECDKQALVELVREELRKYEEGKIDDLSSGEDLANLLGCGYSTLIRNIKTLITKEERKKRKSIITSNIRNKNRKCNKQALIELVKEDIQRRKKDPYHVLVSIEELSELLEITKQNISHLLQKKLSPYEIKFRSDSRKISTEDKKFIGDYIKQELREYEEGSLDDLSTNEELTVFLGCSRTIITQITRKYLLKEEKKKRSDIIKQNIIKRGDKRALIKLIKEDIKIYQRNNDHIVSNDEKLSGLIDSHPETIHYIIRDYLPKDFIKKRSKILHKQVGEKRWQDPEYKKRVAKLISQSIKEHYQDPKNREKLSQRSKALWEDPNFREKMLRIAQDPNQREIISQLAKKRWQDPEFKERASQRMKALWQNQEFRKKIEISWQDSDRRERTSQKMKEKWQDPNYIRKVLEAAAMQPNGLENMFIYQLNEKGLYTPDKTIATPGQIYYPGENNNNWYCTFENRKSKLPDFKVKGQRKVIELYGDYWHSQKVVEKNDGEEYDYKPELLIEEYAKIGVKCKVYWEHEVHEKLEEIIDEVEEWIQAA
jgi:biotin operon repressor